MKKMKQMSTVLGLTFLAGLVACAAAPNAGETPDVDDDDVDTTQLVSNNGWTMNVGRSGSNFGYVYGSATLTGPAGSTSKSGVCLLNVYQAGYQQFRPCTGIPNAALGETTRQQAVDRECNVNALPAGGYRYCEAFNGSGQLYCQNRMGPQTTQCKGFTPPGSFQQLGPGTHTTAGTLASIGTQATVPYSTTKITFWTSVGCLNGPCNQDNVYSNGLPLAIVVGY